MSGKKKAGSKRLSLLHGKLARSSQGSIDHQGKGSRFNPKTWRLNRKEKILVGIILIAVILVPTVLLFPRENQAKPSTDKPDLTNTAQRDNSTATPAPNPLEDISKALIGAGEAINEVITGKKVGPIEGAQTMNSSVWRTVAVNAWNYFRPGVGVDGNTGLPWSGNSYPYFTDWDLGIYVQATIDASKLGLIKKDGDWGFNDRMNKVLTFCETRELNNATYPYWFYQSIDGQVFRDNSNDPNFVADVADTGRLLVALNNLRNYDSALATRVNNLVYNFYGNRSNYEGLVAGIKAESLTSKSVYAYYAASGFASFWPSLLPDATSKILSNIYSSENITVNGVELPKARITSDVLLALLFETTPNDRLTSLTRQVYLAHQNYNQQTSKYRAYGEGSGISGWVWEWVVLPDGRTWNVTDGDQIEIKGTPMIFTKVSLGFLAVYNTGFAKGMSVYIEKALDSSDQGYYEGVDESGQPNFSLGVHTNGLIVGAARYAIEARP